VPSTARPCRCRTSRDAEIASHRLLLVFWHNTGSPGGERKKKNSPAGRQRQVLMIDGTMAVQEMCELSSTGSRFHN
jgi:hypothetical protein